MRNTLADLNNHLFAQMERLSDEDLTQDDLNKEIDRTKAITSVSTQIIENAQTVLSANRLMISAKDQGITHAMEGLLIEQKKTN
jgi:hypothetical protein